MTAKVPHIREIFAIASQQKLRFHTPEGEMTVEDLWSLPLISKQGDANLYGMSFTRTSPSENSLRLKLLN